MTPWARPAVLIWLGFLAACGWGASRAHYTADMSAFLPRSPTPSQQLLVDQLREGVVSRLLLVGIDGAPADTLASLSEDLAKRLSLDPAFTYANNGADDRLTADGAFLLRNRYLLSPGVTPERFSAAGLHEALENDLELLGSALGTLVNRILPNDPTGELLTLLDELQPAGGPQKQHGVWFSADGKRALLVLQTRAAGFDIDAQERAIAQTRAAFAQSAEAHHAAQATLAITGPGVFAVASREAIKSDVSRISTWAVVLVSGLLLAVYRSPRILGLILLPVVTGALAGIVAVDIAFGSVHGITLGFGATLLGEGVDYAIYLFTNALGASSQRSTARIWPTLRLGVMTSVVGFSVLLLSDFTGLAQLGLFSIVGLIVAFAVTRYVLPELAPTGLIVRPVAMLGPRLLTLVGKAHVLRWPLIALIGASLVWLAMHRSSLWDDRLETLSPVPEKAKRLDETLRKELGAPDVGQLLVVPGSSRQGVLEATEQIGAVLNGLQQSGELLGYESPARVLPSDNTQRARQAALPSDAHLRHALTQALRGLEFQNDLFEPFVKDIDTARHAGLLERKDLEGTGLALKFDSLLMQQRGNWVALLPLRGVKNPEHVTHALNGFQGVRLLNLKQEADALYRGYRGQALVFAIAGAGCIGLLLLIALRSIRRVADVLLPLAAAVVATCALLTLGGGQLTMFHLVGLLLVVGVGSNYSLFFERQTLARGDPERTLTSLVLCNVATIIGFGLLALAHAPVLKAIGTTVGVGAFFSLAFAAILESSEATGRQDAAA